MVSSSLWKMPEPGFYHSQLPHALIMWGKVTCNSLTQESYTWLFIGVHVLDSCLVWKYNKAQTLHQVKIKSKSTTLILTCPSISMLTVGFTDLCLNGCLVTCEGCFPTLKLSEQGGQCITKFWTWKKLNWLSWVLLPLPSLRLWIWKWTLKNVFPDSQ